eukprot:GHVT01099848.1.p1 GENE.GHVT01099848.1~~GHVT01099848.1.p1  ORF type:complete len:622 (+),score=96.89 GHVT01099848.1:748-2613(+)
MSGTTLKPTSTTFTILPSTHGMGVFVEVSLRRSILGISFGVLYLLLLVTGIAIFWRAFRDDQAAQAILEVWTDSSPAPQRKKTASPLSSASSGPSYYCQCAPSDFFKCLRSFGDFLFKDVLNLGQFVAIGFLISSGIAMLAVVSPLIAWKSTPVPLQAETSQHMTSPSELSSFLSTTYSEFPAHYSSSFAQSQVVAIGLFFLTGGVLIPWRTVRGVSLLWRSVGAATVDILYIFFIAFMIFIAFAFFAFFSLGRFSKSFLSAGQSFVSSLSVLGGSFSYEGWLASNAACASLFVCVLLLVFRVVFWVAAGILMRSLRSRQLEREVALEIDDPEQQQQQHGVASFPLAAPAKQPAVNIPSTAVPTMRPTPSAQTANKRTPATNYAKKTSWCPSLLTGATPKRRVSTDQPIQIDTKATPQNLPTLKVVARPEDVDDQDNRDAAAAAATAAAAAGDIWNTRSSESTEEEKASAEASARQQRIDSLVIPTSLRIARLPLSYWEYLEPSLRQWADEEAIAFIETIRKLAAEQSLWGSDWVTFGRRSAVAHAEQLHALASAVQSEEAELCNECVIFEKQTKPEATELSRYIETLEIKVANAQSEIDAIKQERRAQTLASQKNSLLDE